MDEEQEPELVTSGAPDATTPIRWEHVAPTPATPADEPMVGDDEADLPDALAPIPVVTFPTPEGFTITPPAIDAPHVDHEIDIGDDEHEAAADDDSFEDDDDLDERDDLWLDDDSFDDEDEDDDWDAEPRTLVSMVFESRAARFVTIVAVVTIAALLMSTVLLWQRIEDISGDVSSVPVKPVGSSELTDLRRRLSRLETQVAATIDPSGNVKGATDELRSEIASLRQCITVFQQQIVAGKGRTATLC